MKLKYRPRRPIKEWREERGWTQAKMANKLGMSRSHYSNLENGHRTAQAKVINRIVKVLALRA